ncbi:MULTISPECIES: hypothetical protein [unclassified Lentimonas]|uniref:hypothetical protein n=1 Tax=unclassified Lentimonas TaxID=2630993 RepID=UPI0013212308|nr:MULTISPECIES: hypothetical protein [unclassified Lentimonas]CAA6692646.1 Unannotated [Lentimonas sp. CC19]CAA6696985.1 Unannotated [Lentimonas sp. CC10]CAA7071009.1 Unannotated [Lentimonas sp. CC11]
MPPWHSQLELNAFRAMELAGRDSINAPHAEMGFLGTELATMNDIYYEGPNLLITEKNIVYFGEKIPLSTVKGFAVVDDWNLYIGLQRWLSGIIGDRPYVKVLKLKRRFKRPLTICRAYRSSTVHLILHNLAYFHSESFRSDFEHAIDLIDRIEGNDLCLETLKGDEKDNRRIINLVERELERIEEFEVIRSALVRALSNA